MDICTPVMTNYGDLLGKFSEAWRAQISMLQQKFSDTIDEIRFPGEHKCDVPIVYVKRNSIIDVLTFLKDEPGFEYQFLSDITALDNLGESPRFEVVYNLFSHTKFWRIRIKIRCDEGEDVPTATTIWTGANWAEREVWDMFGIKFSGHPDLRRILMDARWKGHPLRKDYPLRGYQFFSTPEEIDPELLK